MVIGWRLLTRILLWGTQSSEAGSEMLQLCDFFLPTINHGCWQAESFVCGEWLRFALF
jgi:hypothetical protein